MRVLPDYDGGSIVNLVASLQRSRGSRPSVKPVPWIPQKEVASSKNVVLIVLDGLGLSSLGKYGKGSFLRENLAGSLTSVFPSTTAACVTSFTTGLPVAGHAIPSWFTYVKEFAMMIKPLPFEPAFSGAGISLFPREGREWFSVPTIFERMKCKSYAVTRKYFLDRTYTDFTQQGANVVKYSSLGHMCQQVERAVHGSNAKKFIYSYWDNFDSLCHGYGVGSGKVKKHFTEIDHHLRVLAENLEGTDTSLFITADHGLFDLPSKKNLFVDDYPGLSECLAIPLSGESRAAFCFVRPDKVGQFKRVVKKEFDGIFSLHHSMDLVRKGWFGPGRPHPRLYERIGDFTLVSEGEHCIRDSLYITEPKILKGMHGGLLESEMLVPLISVHA